MAAVRCKRISQTGKRKIDDRKPRREETKPRKVVKSKKSTTGEFFEAKLENPFSSADTFSKKFSTQSCMQELKVAMRALVFSMQQMHTNPNDEFRLSYENNCKKTAAQLIKAYRVKKEMLKTLRTLISFKPTQKELSLISAEISVVTLDLAHIISISHRWIPRVMSIYEADKEKNSKIFKESTQRIDDIIDELDKFHKNLPAFPASASPHAFFEMPSSPTPASSKVDFLSQQYRLKVRRQPL